MTDDLFALLEHGAACVCLARKDKRPLGHAWNTLATSAADVIAGWLGDGYNLGIQYQCVEFVNRYSAQANGTGNMIGTGNAIDYAGDSRAKATWNMFKVTQPVAMLAAAPGGVAVFGELLGVRTFGATLGVLAGGTYNVSAFVRLGALVRLDATRFLIPFTAGDGVLRADGGVAAITTTFMLTASFLGH
jgi:hypothetical protein